MSINAFLSATNLIRSNDIKDIMQGVPADKSGTVKAWFANKADKIVLTLSVDTNQYDEMVNAWMPPARRIDEIKSTYALIGGSRIDLKGKVLASNDNYIIFATPWGDGEKIFGYRVF